MIWWGFLGILIVVLAALLIFTGQQPWTVATISFGSERVSAHFALLLLALIGGFVFIRLLGALFSLPGWLMRAGQKRRMMRSQGAFDQGILLYLQGRYRQAYRHFFRMSQQHSLHYVARLLAAACALAERDFSRAGAALQAAHSFSTTAAAKGDFCVALMQAELLLESGKAERALAQLEILWHQHPDSRKLAGLLLQACESAGSWELLAETLPKLRKLYARQPDKLGEIEVSVAHKLLQLSAKDGDESTLDRQWRETAHSVRPRLTTVYARLLIGVGALQAAERVLREAIESGWEDDCIVCYGDLGGQDVERQLERAEQWLRGRPDNPALLLCLGKLYRQAGSWEQAGKCLKRSYSLLPGQETCRELIRVFEHFSRGKF